MFKIWKANYSPEIHPGTGIHFLQRKTAYENHWWLLQLKERANSHYTYLINHIPLTYPRGDFFFLPTFMILELHKTNINGLTNKLSQKEHCVQTRVAAEPVYHWWGQHSSINSCTHFRNIHSKLLLDHLILTKLIVLYHLHTNSSKGYYDVKNYQIFKRIQHYKKNCTTNSQT